MSEVDRDDIPPMLNGWKEIAAYLGKSVRSVQRWERDLGLPVRRINTPDRGQIIYASRVEIEHWRRRMDRRPGSLEEPEATPRPDDSGPQQAIPSAPHTPEAVPVVAPSHQSSDREQVAASGLAAAALPSVTARRSVLPLLLVVFAAVAGGAFLGRWSATPRRTAERIEFTGTALVAYGGSGQPLWQHDFGEPIAPADVPEGRPVFVDLEGDGNEEVLVPVRFGASIVGPARSDEVVAFRRDGTIAWRATPTARLSQQGRELTGPWTFRALAAPGPVAAARTWIAFSHQSRAPGVVLEVDRTGEARLIFVQDGWLTSLAYWPSPRQALLAIGGVHDRDERASVALFAVDGPPAQAPTAEDRWLRCATCSVDPPAAYYQLPVSEIAIASGRVFSAILDLAVTSGGLRVATDDHQVGLIDAGMQFRMLDYTEEHWAAHRQFEAHRKLDHPADKCRAQSMPREVRAWQRGVGWTIQRVPPELPRIGGCP